MEMTKQEFEKLVRKDLNFAIKEDGLILATTYDNPNLGEELKGKETKPYEHFQVFDQNDQPIIVDGKDLILYRKECHGEKRINGVYHRGGNAFIVNANDEILIPTRSADKDLFPSMSDVSVSEHVCVRESYFDSVLRGFQEEQGVSIEPNKLQLIMKVPVIDSEQSEICEYYVCRTETVKGSDEIASQKWVPIQSLLGKNIGKELNFRPDHLPALEKFISMYK
jgi:isopentenyldiphosphate isomerase